MSDISFDEVKKAMSTDVALLEASRCLQCHEPPCSSNCPAGIDIPAFIRRIRERDFAGAAQKIKEDNLLGGICARACPVERLCEMDCTRKRMDSPIEIASLQRFATDREMGGWKKPVDIPTERSERIAVVGAGPAGLACALELRKLGFRVKIFESTDRAGGIPAWGIPPFRIPRDIARSETQFTLDQGIEIEYDRRITEIDELEPDFQAIFLGCGLGKDIEHPIAASPDKMLYSNRFLFLAEKKELPDLEGKKIGVIGGGDVAFDVARTAVRLGAESTIIYRRTFEEMPAEREEIEAAIKEKIDFKLLTTVEEFTKIANGKYAARLQVMELGEPDGSGRRRPVPLEGQCYLQDFDYLVSAIGSKLDDSFYNTNRIDLDRSGRVKVDGNMMTSRKGVFAGGDLCNMENMVVRAVAEGKSAAGAIAVYLGGDA